MTVEATSKLFSDSFYRKLESSGLTQFSQNQQKVSSLNDRAYHLRNNGMISFLPKGKDCIVNESGNWDRKNRIEIKVGRALRQLCELLGITMNDSEIEKASNQLKSIADDSNEDPFGDISEVAGEEIRKWYLNDNYWTYSGGSSVLRDSCMRYKEAQAFLDIYVDNPEVCRLIILTKEDTKGEMSSIGKTYLLGRALLWTDKDGNKIMDRVYANDVNTELFVKYAKKNGYIFKEAQSRGECRWQQDGKWDERKIFVRLEVDDDKRFPYLDSLYYVYRNGISNRDELSWKEDGFMPAKFLGLGANTDGYYNGQPRPFSCPDCGDKHKGSEGIRIGSYLFCHNCVLEVAGRGNMRKRECRKLHDETWALAADTVSIGRKYYMSNDPNICFCDQTCDYRLIEDTVYDPHRMETILLKDAVFLPELDIYVKGDRMGAAYEYFGFHKVGDEWVFNPVPEEPPKEEPEIKVQSKKEFTYRWINDKDGSFTLFTNN